MIQEFRTYTPYIEYEKYSNKTHEVMTRLRYRPMIECVERYNWLLKELHGGNLEFPLLEIGSGSSWGLSKIRKEFSGQLVVGVDLNQAALKDGMFNGATNLIQGDLTEGLSFRDGSFRTAICFLVLEQIKPQGIEKLFDDLRKVTTADAQLVIATFNRDLFSPHGRKWFTPDIHEYTVRELSEHLGDHGWIPEKVYGQRFVEPHVYSLQATITQAAEDTLKKISFLQQIPLVEIFSPRMCNIAPSIMPYASVEPVEQHKMRKPVIDLFVYQKSA